MEQEQKELSINAAGKKKHLQVNYEEKYQALQQKAISTIIEK